MPRHHLLTLLTLAVAGCATPSTADMAAAGATAADVAAFNGDYADAAIDRPAVSLWKLLTRTEPPPGGPWTNRLSAEQGRLVAELRTGDVILARQPTAFRFDKRFFRDSRFHIQPQDAHVMSAYVTEDQAIGHRADGAIVVVSSESRSLFPVPLIHSGTDEPWVNVFPPAPTSPTVPRSPD